ncbi:MAG: SPFH domain-containing protein, partial [Nanoarchaeota archaeon]
MGIITFLLSLPGWLQLVIILTIVIFFTGVRIVRPTQRAVIERLGKYKKFCKPGFHWIIPFIDRLFKVNITEQMVDAESQEIITNDNLNAKVDAQVYFRVKPDETNVAAA